MRIECSDPTIALAMLDAHQASIDGNACRQEIRDDHDKEQASLSQAKEARHEAADAAAKARDDRDDAGFFGDIADAAGAVASVVTLATAVVPVLAPVLAPVALVAGVGGGAAKICKAVEDKRAADADYDTANHQADAIDATQQANGSKMDASKALDDMKDHVSSEGQQLSIARRCIQDEHASRARLCAQIGGV